jgi:hypothetical protein
MNIESDIRALQKLYIFNERFMEKLQPIIAINDTHENAILDKDRIAIVYLLKIVKKIKNANDYFNFIDTITLLGNNILSEERKKSLTDNLTYDIKSIDNFQEEAEAILGFELRDMPESTKKYAIKKLIK